MNTTLTNDQITAGAAVKCDHGQPIGRNAAIMVFDAMRGAAPTAAEKCRYCGGEGEHYQGPSQYRDCEACEGTGRVSPNELWAPCDASGILPQRDAIAASRRAAGGEVIAWAAESNIGGGVRVLTKFTATEADIDRYVNAEQARIAGCHRVKVPLCRATPAPASAGQAAPAGVSMPEKMSDAVEEQIMGHLYRGVTRGAGPRQIYDSIRSVLAAQPAEVSAGQADQVAMSRDEIGRLIEHTADTEGFDTTTAEGVDALLYAVVDAVIERFATERAAAPADARDAARYREACAEGGRIHIDWSASKEEIDAQLDASIASPK